MVNKGVKKNKTIEIKIYTISSLFVLFEYSRNVTKHNNAYRLRTIKRF